MSSFRCLVTLRGLAYFSASAHIVVGTMCFMEFLDRSIIHVSQLTLKTDTIHIGTEGIVYHWVFLSLGVLIFQGIDRESKTLLKRSAIIFLLFQALTLAVRLKYGPKEMYSDPKSFIQNTGIGTTGLYLVIVFSYVRALETGTQGMNLFHPGAPATHIPLNTSNIGWYNPNASRSSRGSNSNNNNNNNNGGIYSPFNFFGMAGGFNPLVWTPPSCPPPPYTDSAGASETSLTRSLASVHRPHNSQPCSSRAMMTSGSSCGEMSMSSDSKILTTSRTTSADRAEPSVELNPLLDESEDKNGLEN